MAEVPGTILRGVLSPKSNLLQPPSLELAGIVDLTVVETDLVSLKPYALLLPPHSNPDTKGTI